MLYNVYDSKTGVFMMSAPLPVIARFFHLRPEAIDRVERETLRQEFCELFFNGCQQGWEPVKVSRAGETADVDVATLGGL